MAGRRQVFCLIVTHLSQEVPVGAFENFFPALISSHHFSIAAKLIWHSVSSFRHMLHHPKPPTISHTTPSFPFSFFFSFVFSSPPSAVLYCAPIFQVESIHIGDTAIAPAPPDDDCTLLTSTCSASTRLNTSSSSTNFHTSASWHSCS